MSNYRIADAPRGASLRASTCQRCEAEDLKRPVWLTTDNKTVTPYGSYCAAVLLGLVREGERRTVATKALTGAIAAHAAERRIAAITTLNAETARYNTYLARTGKTASLAAYKAYLEEKETR